MHEADQKGQAFLKRMKNCSQELNQLFETWLDQKMQYESCLMEEYYLLGATAVERKLNQDGLISIWRYAIIKLWNGIIDRSRQLWPPQRK